MYFFFVKLLAWHENRGARGRWEKEESLFNSDSSIFFSLPTRGALSQWLVAGWGRRRMREEIGDGYRVSVRNETGNGQRRLISCEALLKRLSTKRFVKLAGRLRARFDE